MLSDTMETAFGPVSREPNLRDLAKILRNLSLDKFWWDYTKTETCAIGISHRIWNEENHSMSEMYNIPEEAAREIFYDVRPPRTFWTILGFEQRRRRDVKPKHVANAIDNFLARRR